MVVLKAAPRTAEQADGAAAAVTGRAGTVAGDGTAAAVTGPVGTAAGDGTGMVEVTVTAATGMVV